ncbi:competence protein ComK [Mesobacillus maritimus]|uniref:competence protein ComK n=1 Tax=Mesobacillus maritimus TaxID=1643336 RepID=UPI00203E4398|nr:competence protein ComK [Mesobacillus maritimus]MCM3586994.1 competence protein ComK [Mesobacillus maritimus]
MKNHYFIDTQFMYMTGQYDRCGKFCAQVTDTNGTFMVDQSPIEILNASIQSIGFNYRGALETSRKLLGDIHMCPIMVNPIHRIVVFPTRSHKHEDAIWLNPLQIKRTISFNNQTMVYFINGSHVVIPNRLYSFNTKLQTAEQLEKMTRGSDTKTIHFILDPAKRRTKDKK